LGTFLSKLILFSHKLSFTINILFLPLRETLYFGSVKLFAEASQFFMHDVLQALVAGKTALLECILQAAKKM